MTAYRNRYSARLITVIISFCLAMPVLAEEKTGTAPAIPESASNPAQPDQGSIKAPSQDSAPVPIPTSPPVQSPATGTCEPCPALEVKKPEQKTAARKKKKIRRKSGKYRKSGKSRKSGASAQKRSSSASSPVTPPSVCSGAMGMEEANRLLATSRDFSGRNLNCLDFSGRDLKGVIFTGATMVRMNLVKANLDDVNLERADLTDADLSGASLHMGRISATSLKNTVLDGALWTDKRMCAQGSLGECRDIFPSRYSVPR